jgi:hypothetical protein
VRSDRATDVTCPCFLLRDHMTNCFWSISGLSGMGVWDKRYSSGTNSALFRLYDVDEHLVVNFLPACRMFTTSVVPVNCGDEQSGIIHVIDDGLHHALPSIVYALAVILELAVYGWCGAITGRRLVN